MQRPSLCSWVPSFTGFNRLAALALLAAFCSACSESSRSGSTEGGAGSTGDDGSVYVFKHGVPQPDDQWSAIIHPTRSIDVPFASLDDAQGREFFGDVRSANGYLFAQDGERMVRYEIQEDLGWSEPVELSFGAYPVDPNFYWSFPAGDVIHVSYDGNKRLVWDPTAMEIVAAKEDSSVPLELDGLPLSMPGNISYIRYAKTAVVPYVYADEDGWVHAPTSYLGIYDQDTHEEAAAVEVPCPGLMSLSQDEQGYTYAAPSHSPLAYLYGEGPRPCIARLTPDYELDEGWSVDYTEWTGGRLGRDFRYVRDGWGLITLLDQEALGADFSGPVDADVIERSWEGKYWQTWRIDFENETAEPIEGLASGIVSGLDMIDDRAFLTVTDYAELPWSTHFYELSNTGSVSLHDQYDGEGGWMKVR